MLQHLSHTQAVVIFVGLIVTIYAITTAWTLHRWLNEHPKFPMMIQGRLAAGFIASSSILIFTYLIQMSAEVQSRKDRAEHWQQIALNR